MKISVYHRNSLAFLPRDFPLHFYTGGKVSKLLSSIKKNTVFIPVHFFKKKSTNESCKNIYSQKKDFSYILET